MTILHILVCFQPLLFDPAEKNKHKFMVQTAFAPEGEFNMDQLWKEITPEQLMDSKLKCVFDLPAEQNESSDDPTKFSPKAASTNASAPNNSVESELQKAAQEVMYKVCNCMILGGFGMVYVGPLHYVYKILLLCNFES